MRGKVTFNNVLIRLHIEPEVEKKTKSGIILPTGIDEETQKKMRIFKEHPLQGDVIQIGEMVKICKVGDRIYFNDGMNDLIEDGVYYSILPESRIIYVIDKKDWENKLFEDKAIKQLEDKLVLN